jgi:hypothetical protein
MPIPTDVQERIRQMEAVDAIQGLQELAPDRIERTARNWQDPVRAGVSYFRIPDTRMERGRITLMENGQNATERVMYRDYVLLRQYGGYHGANHPADWQRTDVYLGIIQRGGLHEFDAEQILDMCWHYRPGRESSQSHRLIWQEIDRLIGQGIDEAAAVYAVMPQLAGRDLTRHTCEACGPDRPFRDAESVRQHRSIMHKDDVQTLGTRDAIAQALQAGGGNMDKLIDVMAQLVEQMAAQNAAPRRGRPPTTPE